MATETKPQRLDLVDDEQSAAPDFANDAERLWWLDEDLPDEMPDVEPDPATGKSWFWQKVNGIFSAGCEKAGHYLGRYAAHQREVTRIRDHYRKLREPFERQLALLDEQESHAVNIHTGPIEGLRKLLYCFMRDFESEIADAMGNSSKGFPVGPGTLKIKPGKDSERWRDEAAVAWALDHFAGDLDAQEQFIRYADPKVQKTPLKKRVVWQDRKPYFEDDSGELVPMEAVLEPGADPTEAMYLEHVPEELIINVDAEALAVEGVTDTE